MKEVLVFIGYIILGILILMAMITIHEFGHYIAGKILKFKINEFSIGFGPKLFSKKLKNGEVFSIRAIPLGGYCAFEGEDVVDEKPPTKPVKNGVFDELSSASADTATSAQGEKTSGGVIGFSGKITGTAKPLADHDMGGLKRMNDQPPWKRIIMFAAGGIFNLVSAVILCFIFLCAVGMPQPQVMGITVDESGLEYNSPLAAGDVITHVDGKSNYLNYVFDGIVASGGDVGDEYTFTVRHKDGSVEDIVVARQAIVQRKQVKDKDGKPIKNEDGSYKYELVYDEENNLVYAAQFGITTGASFSGGIVSALKYSVPLTAKMSWLVLSTLGKLVTLQLDCGSVAGPVGTVTGLAEGTRDGGWQYLLLMMPLIAANLGVFNLLPVPALDGSKIVFAIIEWIRKKPINRNVEGMIHAVGLLVIFGLVILMEITGFIARCGM